MLKQVLLSPYNLKKPIMNLKERYTQLLNNNGYDKEKDISKDEIQNRYNEAVEWIEEIKQFETAEDSKFDEEELKNMKDSIKKYESIHSTMELLGNIVLNEYKVLQSISKESSFPDVLFRRFPTEGLNAHALKYPEGYLVVVEKGLDTFYQLLFAVICRSKAFQMALFKKEVCESLSHKETVDVIGQIFKEYLETKTISDAVFYNYSFTPKDGVIMEAQGFLYREFIFYIMAHELSHVYLNHHSSDVGLKKVLDDKGLYPHFSQSMELSADDLAFKLLFRKERVLNPNGETWESISSNQGKLDVYLFSFFSAITTYFVSSSWIDKIWEYREALISGKEEAIMYDDNTHPSDSLRQLKFMEWIHGAKPDIIRYSHINGILRDIENDLIPLVAKSLL